MRLNHLVPAVEFFSAVEVFGSINGDGFTFSYCGVNGIAVGKPAELFKRFSALEFIHWQRNYFFKHRFAIAINANVFVKNSVAGPVTF